MKCLSELTFFSLTSEQASSYRNAVFTQIHEIVFHGKGGYDWYTIYNMPLSIRNFTWNKLKQWYEEQDSNKNEDVVAKSIAAMKEASSNIPKSKTNVPKHVLKASQK